MVTARNFGPTLVFPDLGLQLPFGVTEDLDPRLIPYVQGLSGVVLEAASESIPEPPATRKKAPAAPSEEK